jgi:hypothetical protein
MIRPNDSSTCTEFIRVDAMREEEAEDTENNTKDEEPEREFVSVPILGNNWGVLSQVVPNEQEREHSYDSEDKRRQTHNPRNACCQLEDELPLSGAEAGETEFNPRSLFDEVLEEKHFSNQPNEWNCDCGGYRGKESAIVEVEHA